MKIKVHLNCTIVCVDGKKIRELFEGTISAQAIPRKGESIWIDDGHFDIFVVRDVIHKLVNGIIQHCLDCADDDDGGLFLSTGVPKIEDHEKWIEGTLVPSMEKVGFKRVDDDTVL